MLAIVILTFFVKFIFTFTFAKKNSFVVSFFQKLLLLIVPFLRLLHYTLSAYVDYINYTIDFEFDFLVYYLRLCDCNYQLLLFVFFC